MKLNCLIVEDSSIQRLIISKLANNHLNLNVLAEFSNAIEAKHFLSLNAIDLLFLDIEMPVVSGFDFLDGLKVKPQVIFITSKPEYAVKAFDYDATDYLQKPISSLRFDAAIKRALNLFVLLNEVKEDDGEFIFVKSSLKKLKLFVSKINYLEASGDYVKIFTDDDMYKVLSTLKTFENDLDGKGFLRVHKSFMINLEKVVNYNSKIVELSSEKIPLSRNKIIALKKALLAI